MDINKIFLVPYCHTDYAWTDPRDWHKLRYIESFGRALDLMRVHPAFTYGADNVAHALDVFLQACPHRADELRQRVREGRFYIANGGYALARPNYVGEEGYVRNLIAGKRELTALTHPPAEIVFFFNADTGVGHSQMPQLLRLSGHRYYAFNRPEQALDYKKIPRQFYWRGADGSEILVSRGDYGGFMHGEYINRTDDNDWDGIRAEFLRREITPRLVPECSDTVMLFYGGDDFIPGWTVHDRPVDLFGFMDRWNKKENTELRFAVPEAFFAELEKKKLPVVEGVLDPCEMSFNAPFKGGASLWRARLETDQLLVRLETLAVLAERCGVPYPVEEIRAMWLRYFEYAGHAMEFILEDDYRAVFSLARENLLSIENRTRELIEAAASAAGEPGEFVVFNPLGFERTETVQLHLSKADGLDGFSLLDERGRELPLQIVNEYTEDRGGRGRGCAADLIVQLRLPPFGIARVRPAFSGQRREPADRAFCIHAGKTPRVPADDVVIDNGVLCAVFRGGHLADIRTDGKTITPAGGIDRLCFTRTPPTQGWIGSWEAVERYGFLPESSVLLQNGPLQWKVESRGTLGPHTACLCYTICRNEPMIYMEARIESDGSEGYFTAGMACDDNTRLRADIPFGDEPRELKKELGYALPEKAGETGYFEQGCRGLFWGRTFASFTLCGEAAALISKDCSIYYLHDERGCDVSLVLNRNFDLGVPEKNNGPEDFWFLQNPPEVGGRGTQIYRYACLFGGNPEDSRSAARASRRLRCPPAAARSFGTGGKPFTDSLIRFDQDNFILSALYRERESYILRFYESEGKAGLVTVGFGFPVRRIEKTDLLGRPMSPPVRTEGGIITLWSRAREIITLQIEPE